MTSHEFRDLIEREAAARGCSTATLCKKAVGNNRLYRTLLNGGSCTLDIADRFINFLNDSQVENEKTAA
jgi:hypothetical protein